jgi:hypothetical protein
MKGAEYGEPSLPKQRVDRENNKRAWRVTKKYLFTLSLKQVTRLVSKDEIEVDATGTANSIQQWSEKAFASDKDQQRAFQVIMSKFVLHFHYESEHSDGIGTGAEDDSYDESSEKMEASEGAPETTTTNGNSDDGFLNRIKWRRLNNEVGNLKRISGI